MKFQVILFDLDGTITDSGPGIMNSVRYALSRFGIENPDPAVLRRFVGPPLTDSFERFYHLSAAEAVKAVGYYREYYSAGGIFENAVYEGITEMLKALREMGCRLYLATSKPQVFAEQILEHFGIRSYFDGVTGSFLDGTRVNKDEVVAEALRQAGVTAEKKADALMVGDREYDIKGAHKHEIPAVGVLFGYGSEEELLTAGADWVIHRPEELISIAAGSDKTDAAVCEAAERRHYGNKE
ncbi:MAG: HAD family hydrolase [Lachnospiraceae bacterium]|nr:HAD family hydrolase [Lachnospiraceae bacterium]